MKHWSFHTQDGQFVERWFSSTNPDAIEEQWVPPELTALEGEFHPLAHRVEMSTGEIVRAHQPSADHEWSDETGRWELSHKGVQARHAQARAKARLIELAEEERHLLRKLVLNQNDSLARASLTKIDEEIAALRAIGNSPDWSRRES